MKLKKEDLEKYIKEHPEATQIEIAVFFGTSASTINKLITEYKIDYTPKNGKKTKIKGEDLRKYLQDFPNATVNEIAMVFHTNDATIRRYLRISGLEAEKRLYKPSAVLKQEIIDYININPRAPKVQMATDLHLSLSVLNLQLNKFRIEWSEKEQRYVNKDDKKPAEANVIVPMEEDDDEYEEFFYHKVKSEEVENYKRSHPNATVRQIAAFFGTTEEKMEKFIKKHNINLEQIKKESYEAYERKHASKEKFVDKVMELLRNNPTVTIEKVQQKISEKYDKNLPVMKSGNLKEAEEIKAFLVRGIDDKRVLEEIVSGIIGNDENEGRD